MSLLLNRHFIFKNRGRLVKAPMLALETGSQEIIVTRAPTQRPHPKQERKAEDLRRLDRGLRDVMNHARRVFSSAPGIKISQPPDGLSPIYGQLGNTGVTLQTTVCIGGGWSRLVFAWIEDDDGHWRSATIIGIPDHGSLLPILGVDLIAFQGTLSLAALDLAPLDQQTWDERCAPILRQLNAQYVPALIQRKRPDFTQGSFSNLAVIVGAKRGHEWYAFEAAKKMLSVAAHLGPCTSHDTPRAEQAWDNNQRWRRHELQNRKEQAAFSRLFGEDVSRSYMQDFLFRP